jgi:hypothetical protein
MASTLAKLGRPAGQTVQQQKRDACKTIKTLKAEVRRKDRVLAETTSLLMLSKKLEALYGEDRPQSLHRGVPARAQESRGGMRGSGAHHYEQPSLVCSG